MHNRVWPVHGVLAMIVAVLLGCSNAADTPDGEGDDGAPDSSMADGAAPDDAAPGGGGTDPGGADAPDGIDAFAGEELLIGQINALDGAFARAAEDAEVTVRMVLDEVDGEVAGRPIRVLVERSDTTPETTVAAARTLVEDEGVHLIHGPLTGGEGMALADYAHSVPHVTFIDGASMSVTATPTDPAANFLRWHPDAAMLTAPLGAYAVDVLGYDTVAVVGENYSFPHEVVGGFLDSYCAAGGTLASASWIPLAGDQFDRVIADLPQDIDAVFVAIDRAAAMELIGRMAEHDLEVPLLGTSVLMGSDLLGADDDVRALVEGAVLAGPVPPSDADLPAWRTFVDTYRGQEGARPDQPTLQGVLYANGMRALLAGIDAAGGVVESDDGERLRAAMRELTVDSPLGALTLDGGNQASGSIFITEVAGDGDGGLAPQLREVVEDVAPSARAWKRLDSCP